MSKYIDYGDDKIPIEEALEKMEEELGEKNEEIDKLTAESTEWEERTYCWQDRAENLQIVLDKIKERVNKVDFEMGDFPELELAGDILELLEEIK